VLLEDTVHVLVKTEEGGISGGSFEVFHDTGRKVELALGIRLATEENMSIIVQTAIVSWVNTVQRRFDSISKMVNTVSIVDVDVCTVSSNEVSVINGINETSFVDDHVTNSDVTLNIGELDVIGTAGEFASVSVSGVGSESFNNGSVPVQGLNHVQSVGKTFRIEAGSKLVMGPEEKFSLAVQMVTIGIIPPEGIINMPGNVMDVHTDIFSEVGNMLFGVLLGSGELHVEVARSLCHLSSVGLLDDFRVGEKVRSNFVHGRHDENFSVSAVSDHSVNGIDELAFVHLLSEEGSILDSTFPSMTMEKNLEEHQSFLSLASVEKREPMMALQESVIIEFLHESSNSSSFIVIHGEVSVWDEGSSVASQLLIMQRLSDFVEKGVQRMLPFSYTGIICRLIREHLGPGRG